MLSLYQGRFYETGRSLSFLEGMAISGITRLTVLLLVKVLMLALLMIPLKVEKRLEGLVGEDQQFYLQEMKKYQRLKTLTEKVHQVPKDCGIAMDVESEAIEEIIKLFECEIAENKIVGDNDDNKEKQQRKISQLLRISCLQIKAILN